MPEDWDRHIKFSISYLLEIKTPEALAEAILIAFRQHKDVRGLMTTGPNISTDEAIQAAKLLIAAGIND